MEPTSEDGRMGWLRRTPSPTLPRCTGGGGTGLSPLREKMLNALTPTLSRSTGRGGKSAKAIAVRGENGGMPGGLESSGSEGRIRALRRRRMVRDLEQFLAVHLVGFVGERNSEAGNAFASN